MQLDNRMVEFINDKVKFKEFMDSFMGLVSAYHESYNSSEFVFDYSRFIIEWQSGKLGVFVAYDGDKPVGFTLASVMYAFFDNKPTLTMTHAYLKDEYRGDVEYITRSTRFVIDSASKFGCDSCIVLTDPELMPLIMNIGGTKILYSGVEMV